MQSAKAPQQFAVPDLLPWHLFNRVLLARLLYNASCLASPQAGIAKKIMFLRPNFLKFIILVILFALTLLIATERKPTSKITWEETRGIPLTFVTLIEYRGPCASEEGYCTGHSIQAIEAPAFLFNLIGLYLLACGLVFGYERLLAVSSHRKQNVHKI